MKNIFYIFLVLLVLLFLTGPQIFSQTINSTTYAFSSSTGSLEDISGLNPTTLLGGNVDDASSPGGGGFDYWFAGVKGNLSFSVNSNGLARLVSGVVSTSSANDLATATDLPKIVPYWDDLRTGLNGGVRYKVLGSAPNRKLVIDYYNMQVPKGTAGASGSANFQVWIYETTGVIEFVYGSGMAANPGGYTIGIGNSATQFASITTSDATCNYTVSNNTQTDAIAAGTKYTFTPEIPAAPTNLIFSNITGSGVKLDWTDNATNETHYEIYNSLDGVTYNFYTELNPNTTTRTNTGLLAATTYYWKIFAVSQGGCSAVLSGSMTTLSATTKTSVAGAVSWNLPTSWSPSGVPDFGNNVIISDGSTVTLNTNSFCNSLTVGQGSGGSLLYDAVQRNLTIATDLTINQNASFTAGSGSLTTSNLNIGVGPYSGNFTNNGIFDMNTTAGVNVSFGGSSNAIVSGSGIVNDFYSITVNKGTDTSSVLDIKIPVTLSSPASAGSRLSVSVGTFKLSSASVLTPFYGSFAYLGIANSRIWLNNPGASLSSVGLGTIAGTFFLRGHLQIDSGTFSYGSGLEVHGIDVSQSSASLVIHGGTLNLYGGCQVASSSLNRFIMTGGTINIDPQAGSNLSTGSSIFSIGANSIMDWSGGNINIINPHSAIGGTAFSIASGGSKSITGGTLTFGDGISVKSSGTGSLSGFGISSAVPIYNIVANTRTDVQPSRMLRLIADLSVNNVTIDTNSYLFLGTGTSGKILNILGNLINYGTLACAEPGGTQSVGTLCFKGTSGTQTLSGNGAFANCSTLVIDHTGSGVIFSNTGLFKVRAVNLLRGSLNEGSNFVIGNTIASTLSDNPVLTIGGNPSVNGGRFTSVPVYDETDGGLVINYYNLLGAHTIGASKEIGTGTQTVSTIQMNDTDGAVIPSNISLSVKTLIMLRGDIDLSGGNLTIGTGISATGTLTYTAGYIKNGSLTRWYGTSGLPTSPGFLAGFYPLGINGNNRNTYIYFNVSNALSTGGTISVSHTSINSVQAITGFTDGGITVNKRSKSSWTLSSSGIVLSGANRISMRIQGSRAVTSSDVTALRLILAGSAVGTSSNGTNTATDPQVNRTSMTVANINNIFYIGGNNSNLSAAAVSWIGGDGNWSDAANWSLGYVPTSADNVLISSSSSPLITVDGNYSVADFNQVDGVVQLTSYSLTVIGDFTQSNGVMNLGTGNLKIAGNFERSGGVFNGNNSTLTFNGTLPQTINFFDNDIELYDLVFSNGGAGNPKVLTSGLDLSINDLNVASTAQLSLSSAAPSSFTLNGDLAYSGITGGANLNALSLILSGLNNTIQGSAATNNLNINKKADEYSTRITTTNYSFIQNEESENVRSLLNIKAKEKDQVINVPEKTSNITSNITSLQDKSDRQKEIKSSDQKTSLSKYTKFNRNKIVVKPVVSQKYTKANMKDVIERIFASQSANERIVIILEDGTLIKNPPAYIELTPSTAIDIDMTIIPTAHYSLSDNISVNTNKTLTVFGRLDCSDNTIGGAGNISVIGEDKHNDRGVIGTSNASASGFNNFTNTGTQSYSTGNEMAPIIDYNSPSDQIINISDHPANTLIMCSTGGTKTLSANYVLSGGSGSGSAGLTLEQSKGTLTVNSGATFADGGHNLIFTSGFYPTENIIVQGTYLSTGTGKISWDNCTFSTIFAKTGTAFGELEMSNFLFSPNLLCADGVTAVNISARAVTINGNSPGVWNLSSTAPVTLTITGDLNLTQTTHEWHGGGFTGYTGMSSTVKLKGNLNSSSYAPLQNIFAGDGTKTFEMNGTSAQTISFSDSATNVLIFPGTTFKINNPAGVTMTNNNSSACTFALDSAGGLSIQDGSLNLGNADNFVFDQQNSFASFGSGAVINNSSWPVTNGPVNIDITGSCTLPGNRTISGVLNLSGGKLSLGSNTLTKSSTGTITGGSQTSYIKTDGTGGLKYLSMPGGTDITFPVGNTSYNPAIINYAGTVRDWTLAVKDSLTSGIIGNNPTAKIKREWEITPSSVVGVSASLTLQWNETDEDVTFDRNGSMVIAHYNSAAVGNGWFPYSSSPAINGTVPNSHKTIVTGMTEFSPYAIANDGPLPVELASFNSILNSRDVKLNWSTNHESNNAGFDIERILKVKTDSTWKKIGHVSGAGTTNVMYNYNFDDKKLDAGKYSYRLKQIDYNGNFKYFDLSNEIIIGVPDKYSVSQNYPNPFNPTTKIDYNLPFDSKVSIKLFDMTGREVATIVNNTQLAGYYTILFNASALSSGTYFYNIVAEGGKEKFVQTKKMMLVK